MGASFTEAILRGEDRLLERILAYAEATGFLRFTSRNPEAWRPTVRGISGSIVQAFRNSGEPPSLTPKDLRRDEALTAFVVVEARKYRLGGMPFGVFLGLGKIFRLSYDDLVRSEGFPADEETRHRLYIERFFDRNEIASCVSWARESSFERAEELLRKNDDLSQSRDLVATAKEEWEGAIDCVGDMLLLADPHGRLHRCNRAFREFTGRPYEQILGRPYGQVLREAGLAADIPRGQAVERFHEQTGEWFVLNLYRCRHDSGEAAEGIVVTIHNATGIMKAARELEGRYERVSAALSGLRRTHAEVLRREKAAVVGRVASGVANDLHPPAGLVVSNLNTLGMYIGRIKEFLSEQSACIDAGAPPAKVEALRRKREQLKLEYLVRDLDEMIGETVEGAETIRTVASDLKSFSRKETGAYQPADINECVREAVHSVRSGLEGKGTLKTEFGELPVTRCSAGEMTRAFRNLLSHAANALGNRGVVTVRTWPEGGSVCVSIGDTGQSIPGDRLDRIFDPYFSARETGEGEGLGLSIAYDIVGRHEGEIRVRSKPGEGTTFTVRVPVVEEA
jgi:two-component system NtrC family sensor kinase